MKLNLSFWRRHSSSVNHDGSANAYVMLRHKCPRKWLECLPVTAKQPHFWLRQTTNKKQRRCQPPTG